MYKQNTPLDESERLFYTDVFIDLDSIAEDPHINWKRLFKCTAWYHTVRARYDSVDYNVIALKSYSIVVALFDLESNQLISRGRYSQTTYKHVYKFRKLLIESGYTIKGDNNLNLVSWFNN